MVLPTFAYRLIGRFSTSRLDRRLHPLLYRLAGGRWITGHVLGCEMVLLTSTGRRSGTARTVALFAFPWDRPPGSLAVVASRGGSRRIPDWYRNLQARPAATVRVGRRSFPVRARDAEGEEYAEIFELAARAYPGYRLYRAESPVRIPIVVLEPSGVEAGSAAGSVVRPAIAQAGPEATSAGRPPGPEGRPETRAEAGAEAAPEAGA